MRAVTGSYFEIAPSMYQALPAANPGWQLAPVPGWGTNPERSGPPMLATNGSSYALAGDTESESNQGYIALAAAGGIFLGWFLCWAYHYSKGKKKA